MSGGEPDARGEVAVVVESTTEVAALLVHFHYYR